MVPRRILLNALVAGICIPNMLDGQFVGAWGFWLNAGCVGVALCQSLHWSLYRWGSVVLLCLALSNSMVAPVLLPVVQPKIPPARLAREIPCPLPLAQAACICIETATTIEVECGRPQFRCTPERGCWEL